MWQAAAEYLLTAGDFAGLELGAEAGEEDPFVPFFASH